MPNGSTEYFPAWNHSHIKGEPVDTTGLPFSDEFFSDKFGARLGALDDDYDSIYRRTGPHHGRSYEVAVGTTVDDKFVMNAVWEDQYGNPYTTLTTKGNNFREQKVFFSATAPSGILPFGLQEGDALQRVLLASRLLRENNIGTEWIVRVLEPEQLQFGDERVDQLTFKRRLLEKVILTGTDSEGPADAENVTKISAALEPMKFFVTLRAMAIPDRPFDFVDDSESTARQRVERIFRVLGALNPGFKAEESRDKNAVTVYFVDVLPQLLASNFAKLHNIGLSHGFPASGNVTVLGDIVDLDSVSGEPLGLGDTPRTAADYARDLNYLFDRDMHDDMPGMLAALERHNILSENDGRDWVDHFAETFYDGYFDERDYNLSTEDGAVEYLDILYQLLHHPITAKMRTNVEAALTTLTAQYEGLTPVVEAIDVGEDPGPPSALIININIATAICQFAYGQNLELKDMLETYSRDDFMQLVMDYDSEVTSRHVKTAYTNTLRQYLQDALGLDAHRSGLLTTGYYLVAADRISEMLKQRTKNTAPYEIALDEFLEKQRASAHPSWFIDVDLITPPDKKQTFSAMPFGEQLIPVKSGVPLVDLLKIVQGRLRSLSIVDPKKSPAAQATPMQVPDQICSNSQVVYLETAEGSEGVFRFGPYNIISDDPVEYIAGFRLSTDGQAGSLDLQIIGDTEKVMAAMKAAQ